MLKKDQAYNHIKDQIVSQQWKSNHSIDINEICTFLNVSRSPVMEALKELEQEEYVTIVPQVGAYVRQISSTDLVERLLMRASLEGLMTEWAVKNITKRELEKLAYLIEQMEEPDLSMDEYGVLNREYHQVIYDASDLKYIKKVVEESWDYMEYLDAQTLIFEQNNKSQSIIEHKMIYYNLADRNEVIARQLMEQHILRAINLSEQ